MVGDKTAEFVTDSNIGAGDGVVSGGAALRRRKKRDHICGSILDKSLTIRQQEGQSQFFI